MTWSIGSGGDEQADRARPVRGQCAVAVERAGAARRCARARRFPPRCRRWTRRAPSRTARRSISGGEIGRRLARRPARPRSAAGASGSTRAGDEAHRARCRSRARSSRSSRTAAAADGRRRGWRGRCRSRRSARHRRPARRAGARRRTPRPCFGEHRARAGAPPRAQRFARSPRRWRSARRSAAGRARRLFGNDRIERLGGAAERLVEAGAARSAPKRRCERGARHGDQLADPLEAEPAGGAEHVLVEAQGGERHRRERIGFAAGGAESRSARRRSGRARCAAPGVPATAMRAAKPSRAQKARMRSHILRSPPNRWATPLRSSHRPSGPESAARGVQRRAANRPRRRSQAASPSGSAARTSRPETRMRALVSGMPGARPSARAAGQAAASRF